MSSSAAAAKMQKIMLQPISLIFRYLQNKMTICIWLFDHAEFRIQGRIIGFDEYMNVVLDDAKEIYVKTGAVHDIGKIMLKGDNIALIQTV